MSKNLSLKMGFENRDIISIKDFSKEELMYILKTAEKMEKIAYSNLLKEKILATLFFEPSTRTRLSFEAAMHRLGGNVIGFSNSSVTSIAKGETLQDTIKIIGGYSDVIVIRHPMNGAAKIAADATLTPIINAGDGSNEHPTQTFVDLYTILKTKKTLDNLSIGFLGDLKYGRTVHSLVNAMAHFNARMFFISPMSLRMPKELLSELDKKRVIYSEEEDLFKVSKKLDILYVTRIQKERFLDPLDHEKVRNVYKLDKSLLKHAKKDLKILHPLPRVNEINPNLDNYEQSIYFQQAHNGVAVRKALLALVLGAVNKVKF